MCVTDRKEALTAENKAYFGEFKETIVTQVEGIRSAIETFVKNSQGQATQIMKELTNFSVLQKEVSYMNALSPTRN
jgi:hypothetical protein